MFVFLSIKVIEKCHDSQYIIESVEGCRSPPVTFLVSVNDSAID